MKQADPAVQAGDRFELKASRVPWRQSEDLTVTVSEVYTLSELELKGHDVVTAAAMRGVEYAVCELEGGGGIQLPVDDLLGIGERLSPLPPRAARSATLG